MIPPIHYIYITECWDCVWGLMTGLFAWISLTALCCWCFRISAVSRHVVMCISMIYIYSLSKGTGVADIRGGNRRNNSSVRLDHLLT